MIKKLLISLTLALTLSTFVAFYFFIKAVNDEEYLLEKSNDKTAIIFKHQIDSARLKRLIAADTLALYKNEQSYDFVGAVENLRNNKQFIAYATSNINYALDQYIPNSGNRFIRYDLTDIDEKYESQQEVISDKCWQASQCKKAVSLMPSHINPQNFKTSYDEKGTLMLEFPIFEKGTSHFIGKLSMILNISDSTIYRSHEVSVDKYSELDNTVSSLKLSDKRAIFGDRFSYSKTYLIGSNLAITIYTPYTSLIKEKLDVVRLLFFAIFILVFSTLNYLTQRKNNAKLQIITYNDQLTGLYNRQYFDSEMFLKGNQKHLQNGGKISIIILDGDGIKSVNDTYGHAVGDTAIQHIANTISQCTRDSDVTFRMGGDEFMIVLRADEQVAETVTNRIKTAMQDQKMDLMNIHIMVSVGFTELQPEESLDSAINRADKLLYIDKAKNQQEMS